MNGGGEESCIIGAGFTSTLLIVPPPTSRPRSGLRSGSAILYARKAAACRRRSTFDAERTIACGTGEPCAACALVPPWRP